MGQVALYRKYRPARLSEVIGQDHITTVLEAAVKSGRVSHAYLLTGQRGTGKTSVARILARQLNQIVDTAESFDIIEIDAASHGLKEDIKELIEKSVIAPIRDKYKIYIIDEVHSMKHDAFNTFLKLLEEPPAHVVFILATTDPQKLPATILSRAQRYHFRPVELKKVAKHLRKIADAEKIDITDEALKIIAERGGGSLRDSISLLDQLGNLDGKIDANIVEDILGLAPDKKIAAVVAAIKARDTAKLIQVLSELESAGVSGRTVADQLIKKLLEQATQQPELFELIDKLVDSVEAFDIYLKLRAVLAAHLVEVGELKLGDGAPALLRAEPVKPVVSEALTEVSSHDETIKPVKKPAEADLPATVDWDKFVAAATKINRTCGSSLATASHDYDGETLTLYFTSKIFRARMQESKWKSVLNSALGGLYDTPPEIVISDGVKPKNQTLAAVADIMGGGEAL
ncbi:MAG: DNA polymerase III subunit gamma/tau [Candidatus Nomurabacteria bacterium]|jgi:DNA polymerase-3 subunit gamma/tau|nr:DNA polymerase III subunit gamma/tau [Candidatus Nomurabacteria bacterium]